MTFYLLFLLYLKPNNKKRKNIINWVAYSLETVLIFAQYVIHHKLFIEVRFLLFFVAVKLINTLFEQLEWLLALLVLHFQQFAWVLHFANYIPSAYYFTTHASHMQSIVVVLVCFIKPKWCFLQEKLYCLKLPIVRCSMKSTLALEISYHCVIAGLDDWLQHKQIPICSCDYEGSVSIVVSQVMIAEGQKTFDNLHVAWEQCEH